MEGNYTKAKVFGATEVGQVRTHNEDNFLIIDSCGKKESHDKKDTGILLMVADGMGGANAGEVASAIACEVVKERFSKLHLIPASPKEVEKYLKNLILEVHHQIIRHANKNPECKGMGTTAVLGWIIDSHLHVTWCGDSRCYTSLPGHSAPLQPLTDDHSLVWQMVIDGEITPEQARVHEYSNIILQSLGSTDSKPKPSYLNKKLSQGEKVLLCSDGLNGMLSDWEIQKILESTTDVQEKSRSLVEAANKAGGTDNITVVLAEIESLGRSSGKSNSPFTLFSKAKWPLLLLLAGLLGALLYLGVLKQNQKFFFTKQNEDPLDENFIELNEPDRSFQGKEDKAHEPLTSFPPKKASSAAGDTTSYPDFNFQEELTEISAGLEKIVESNRKLMADCHKCSEDLEFEKVNNLLADTQLYVREQLNFIQKKDQNFQQNEQSLQKICVQAGVSFSLDRAHHPDERSKKIWISRTLYQVVEKIDQKFKKLIKHPTKTESAS